MSNCCDSQKPATCHSESMSTEPVPVKPVSLGPTSGGGCCGPEPEARAPFDWLLWGCLLLVAITYSTHLFAITVVPEWLMVMSHGVFELMNTMWWGIVLAALFVGVLAMIPQEMVLSVLGQGGTVKGLWRATLAGVLMDLCSHGILMVGMKLYQRGASLGQVMAFLIASPWNSLSLTIILVALIGLPWTLAFIALSMLLALTTGWIFDRLVDRGKLPANPNTMVLSLDYKLWPEVRRSWSGINWSGSLLREIFWEGLKGSRMVLRWLLFGVLLATAIRSFVDVDNFQNWFGPTTVGLAMTLIAATIIEVCSEGSTPIAADLLIRAKAPGNSFAFLMTGVSTDYTEVMVIKDTTRSWKIALFLPLLAVPQVIVIALILNGMN